LLTLVFPEDCRVCETPLTTISRIPVCSTCLRSPEPLRADAFCEACRTPFADDSSLDANGLCAVCRSELPKFDSAYSFGAYDGVLRKLIHLFKYGKVETLAQPLGQLLVQALPLEERFEVVIAMPMHPWKKWQRGFNQSELLAEPVARRLGLKLCRNLRRSRVTKPQAGLNEAERRENLKDSFVVKRPEEVAGKRVLLVDDVFTTGATLRAAGKALKSANVRRVSALTLARVDRRLAPSARLTGSTRKSGATSDESLEMPELVSSGSL
jgi:ComF family protein